MAVSDELSFELIRVVDVPVERVWRAWSDADLVKRWWGPSGFSCTRADIRLAVGSSSVVTMRSGDGREIHNLWTYTVVEPMERIEFHSQFCDPDGNPVRPSDIGMPAAIPERVRHVVTLHADGRTTILTVQEFGYAPGPILDMSKAGQEQCLDKLADVAAEA